MKTNFQLHRPQFLKSDDHPTLKRLTDKVRTHLGHPASTALQANEAPKAKDRTNRQRFLGMPMLTFTVGADKVEACNAFADKLRHSQSQKGVDRGGLSFEALAGGHANKALADFAVKGTYQVVKENLFGDVNAGLQTARRFKVATVMECMNVLHNKEGHNKNTVATTKAFMAEPCVRDAILTARRDAGEKRSFSLDEVVGAAQFHGLADRDIPVAVLARLGRLTDAENETYIRPRSANSARIFDTLNLGGKNTSDLIRQTRVFGTESKSRPIEAQLLDLADRLCGISAKGFFKMGQDPDGKVDVDKVFESVKRSLQQEDVYIDPHVMAAVRLGAEAGLLDQGVVVNRREAAYVRK